jgi:hypothetical protein
MTDSDWNPVEDRRAFLGAVGAAGFAGVAGCVGDGSDGGDGGDGNGSSDGTDGSDSDPSNGRSTYEVSLEDNEQIPDERRDFAIPMEKTNTSFDASVQDGTKVFDSENMDAMVDADVTKGLYTFDSAQLQEDLQEGDVMLISGVDLGKVTSIQESGGETTVETEQATLDEAIEEGTLEWDSTLNLDFQYSPDDENREIVQSGSNALDAVPVQGAPATTQNSSAFFTGVEMVGEEETEAIPLHEMAAQGESLEWTFTDGVREYKFKAEKTESETTIAVQVKQPADGDANLAMTAKGTVGNVQSKGTVEYSDNELQSFDLNQDNVEADFEISMSAAGSKDGKIDWEFPGMMFKYVIFVGPVPVTLSFNTKLIGNITVPSADGSATGTSRFNYNANTGFAYEGTDVDVQASVGDQPIEPESTDAAAFIGESVDLQFGVAYPRIEISVFEQTMIPFIEFGMVIGSRLRWGPQCKSGYVRMVINAGYDFEILGQSLASDKITLFEEQERSWGSDNCDEYK